MASDTLVSLICATVKAPGVIRVSAAGTAMRRLVLADETNHTATLVLWNSQASENISKNGIVEIRQAKVTNASGKSITICETFGSLVVFERTTQDLAATDFIDVADNTPESTIQDAQNGDDGVYIIRNITLRLESSNLRGKTKRRTKGYSFSAHVEQGDVGITAHCGDLAGGSLFKTKAGNLNRSKRMDTIKSVEEARWDIKVRKRHSKYTLNKGTKL